MAKQPKHPKHLYQEPEAPAARSRSAKMGRRFRLRLPPWRGTLCVVVLAAYLAAAYLLPQGHELPWFSQRLAGLGFVGLLILAFVVTRPRRELSGEVLRRLRTAQHPDFGKQLRAPQKEVRRTVRLPLLGETSFRFLIAAGLAFASAIWWLTPWAPIRAARPRIDDLTISLGDEIVAAALVMPNPHMAVAAPPVLPQTARKLARLIPDNVSNYSAALKAIGLGHFSDARPLLSSALKAGEEGRIPLAQAQLEMFAGHYPEAVQYYQTALEHERDAKTLCQLAVALIQAGRYSEAQQAADDALDKCPNKSADNDPTLAGCKHVAGLLALLRGKPLAEAHTITREGGEIWQHAPGDCEPFVAASCNNRGVVHLFQGNYNGAVEMLRQADDDWGKLGAGDLHQATVRGNLAMLNLALGEFDTAQAEVAGAADQYREALPKEHPWQAVNLTQRAVLLRARGDYPHAQAAAESALTISEKTWGGDQLPTAAVLQTVAGCDYAQARYTKANTALFRSIRSIQKLCGPAHFYLAAALDLQARVKIDEERFDEAAELCAQGERISYATLGRSSPEYAAEQYTQARLAIARGRPRDARTFLDRAQKLLEDPKDQPALLSVLGDMASLDTSPLTLDHGLSQYKRTIAAAQRQLGETHPEVGRLYRGAASLFVLQENYSAAAKALQRAREIEEAALPKTHPELAATWTAYAAVLKKLTPPDDQQAAELLQRAAAMKAKHREEEMAP
jgi:tetratricopeptide (TPR) repeat protein